MFFFVTGEHNNVVHIYVCYSFQDEFSEHFVHHGLEDCRAVAQPKEHDQRLKEPMAGPEGCLPLIACLHAYVVVSLLDIDLAEDFLSSRSVNQLGQQGQGIGVVVSYLRADFHYSFPLSNKT